VNEYVVAPIFALDEAKSLGIVEPFDLPVFAIRHGTFLCMTLDDRASMASQPPDESPTSS
jgi:hypothetical protein